MEGCSDRNTDGHDEGGTRVYLHVDIYTCILRLARVNRHFVNPPFFFISNRLNACLLYVTLAAI